MLTGHELAYQLGELRPRLLLAYGYYTLEESIDWTTAARSSRPVTNGGG
jgi:hypothetical protein